MSGGVYSLCLARSDSVDDERRTREPKRDAMTSCEFEWGARTSARTDDRDGAGLALYWLVELTARRQRWTLERTRESGTDATARGQRPHRMSTQRKLSIRPRANRSSRTPWALASQESNSQEYAWIARMRYKLSRSHRAQCPRPDWDGGRSDMKTGLGVSNFVQEVR